MAGKKSLKVAKNAAAEEAPPRLEGRRETG
jgi:hypothetical protein